MTLKCGLRPVYSDTTPQLNSTQLKSTQLNWTQLRSINERSNPVDSVCRSWRHKLKTRLTWLYAVQQGQLSWVEFSWVQLSCLAINTPLEVTESRWKWCHLKAWVRFPIPLHGRIFSHFGDIQRQRMASNRRRRPSPPLFHSCQVATVVMETTQLALSH